MNNKIVLISAFLVLLWSMPLGADSCNGRGTVIFFANGMFNTKDDAKWSSERLSDLVKQGGLVSSEKDIKVDLAYKHSESFLEQLVNIAAQKGVTEFELFWAWFASLTEAPSWFKAAIERLAGEVSQLGAMHFVDIKGQFESYSKYIREGYNVILVSHSQGNFYANQAMSQLKGYIDGSWTGSIEKKRKINSNFPKFFELFSNIQVATPVSATINLSPWTTVKDDLIIATVRKTAGALPPNINSFGAGLPPSGDFLGHNFVRTYLHNKESRQKILNEIIAAHTKLRYPIAYFQNAVMIEYEENLNDVINDHAYLSFGIYAENEFVHTAGSHNEKNLSPDVHVKMDFITCFELPMGDSPITALTILTSSKHHEFRFKAWPNGQVDKAKEKPIDLKIFAKEYGSQLWDIGVIHAKAGTGKEPLHVEVDIYPKPKLRHK